MGNKRFTIQLSLHDAFGDQRPLFMAIDVDTAMRILPRYVYEIKLLAEVGAGDFGNTVSLLKSRQIRREEFVHQATHLAQRMVDMLEDAEGWHDESRIGPSRAALGGEWK